jgi:hypothetical protein
MYINELWIKAMNKLKDDKSMFNNDDNFSIANFIHDYKKTIPIDIINQITKDMTTYKKYDAIAMWVGDGGLIEHEPEFVKELVGLFGIE